MEWWSCRPALLAAPVFDVIVAERYTVPYACTVPYIVHAY